MAVIGMTTFSPLGEAATELERAARKASELAELCDLCAIYLSHPDLLQFASDVKSAAWERLAEIERLFLTSENWLTGSRVTQKQDAVDLKLRQCRQ